VLKKDKLWVSDSGRREWTVGGVELPDGCGLSLFGLTTHRKALLYKHICRMDLRRHFAAGKGLGKGKKEARVEQRTERRGVEGAERRRTFI